MIARLRGSTFPDQWVIRGNHHDAWVNGAEDPVSGMAATLEEARALGELHKQGWSPKRTIIYCAWDGEEPALLGSTEWAETHDAELQQHAVAYVNSDDSGRGFPRGRRLACARAFHQRRRAGHPGSRNAPDASGSGSRRKAIDEAKPEDKEKVRSRADWRIGALGSGSDFTPFLQHLGVPTLEHRLRRRGRAAASITPIYDDFYFYTHFLDTDFAYGRTLAQTGGTAVIRLADADILPFQHAQPRRHRAHLSTRNCSCS